MFAILRRKPLLYILICALAIRCVAAVAVQNYLDSRFPPRQFVIAGDANGYWELGNRISKGDGYEVHGRKILRMPGFPLVLAMAISVGQSVSVGTQDLLLARLLLALVGTSACLLVYRLGEDLFGRTEGLLAAGWVAVSPTLVGLGALILSETLFALTLLLTLITGLRAMRTIEVDGPRTSRIGWGLLAGIATATGVYVRPGWILAAPVFCIALVLFSLTRRQASVATGVALLLGLVVTLFPWAWRNHSVSGHWVFTTLWSGPSLYDGLNPAATGDSNMQFIEDDQAFATMNEYEVDRHYRDRAIAFVKQNPWRTVQLGLAKLARYWSPVPNAQQFAGAGPAVVAVLSFVPLMVLAIYGGWVYRDDFRVLLLTVGPIVYFAALHSVFVGSVRYRLPAEYPLSVLAAAGLCNWLRMHANKRQMTTS